MPTEAVFSYCSACHSAHIVQQQGLTRDDWDALLVWMVEEQGMTELDAPDRTLVLDDLAANSGRDRPHWPRRAGTPPPEAMPPSAGMAP